MIPSTPEPAPDPAAAEGGALKRDVGVAARNAVKLGLSLIGTWTVTLLVRFQLPRFLGPEVFGRFSFAENFAAAFFAFLDFGVDVYIQKEIAVRPRHASEFFGSIVLLRGAIALALVIGMASVLRVTSRPADVQLAAVLFAGTYFLLSINNTLAAMLQASSKIDRLVASNILGKLTWGAALGAFLWTGQPMPALTLPMLGSEVLRTALLFHSVRAAIDLRLRIDARAALRVLKSSLPYFISCAAIVITARLNVSMLEFLVPDKREIGWLSAAMNLGSLALMMTPLLSWIVMPMLSRARHRDSEEVFTIIRSALEGLIVVTVPLSLFIGLGASYWIHIAFGRDYAPAAMSLAMIAPQFVFTYPAIILSMALVTVEKQWVAARISATSLVLSPLFVLLLVPLASRLGEGGAAAGAATAVVFSELIVAASCLHYVGRRAVSRQIATSAAKSAAIAASVIALDRALLPIGWPRLLIDMAAYAAASLATGVLRVRDVAAVIRLLREGRRRKAA